MDLGIGGRRAIVCASSGGLGRACAEALAAEGVEVVVNGRSPAKLDEVAKSIAAAGGKVAVALGDVTTPEGRAALLAACPDPDILVNNNGGPPMAAFDGLERDDWMRALEANMVAPLLLTRAVLPKMRERKFGRIVNITSAMVTTPRPLMTLSAGARAGLTAAMKGLALSVAPDNVTINNMLPERFDTERQVYMAHQAMQRDSIGWDEARAQQVASIAAKRLGRPEEFGKTCAFLCSAYAGFMSGLNMHLDGGSYPALV